MTTMNGAETLLMSQASGTGMNPRSWPLPMRMISARRWSLMFMGTAFLVDTQQSGPRGRDKLYSGKQHPHNLIMGLGFSYAYPLGEAAELPEAPLGHHWEDSTHIADEVVTPAIMHKFIRLEASGSYGTEPGENRWIIQYGPINSWSTRLSLFPAKNWMAQVSVGRLNHPEREEPGDVVRSTASLHYSRPMQGSAWSSSLIWGRNHEIFRQHNTDAYTLESAIPLSRRNFLTGRVELVDKDELFSDDPAEMFPAIETGIGANFTTYTLPSAITPYYGRRPVGVNVYLRARLRSRK